jgi:hypothetical protein
MIRTKRIAMTAPTAAPAIVPVLLSRCCTASPSLGVRASVVVLDGISVVVEPAAVDSELTVIVTAVSVAGDPVVIAGGSVAAAVVKSSVEVGGSVAVAASIVVEASVEAAGSVVTIDVEVRGGVVVGKSAIVKNVSVVAGIA